MGVLVDKFIIKHQFALVANKADGLMGCVNKSVGKRSKEALPVFCPGVVSPVLDSLV